MFPQWDIYANSTAPTLSTFRELGIELSDPIADTYYA